MANDASSSMSEGQGLERCVVARQKIDGSMADNTMPLNVKRVLPLDGSGQKNPSKKQHYSESEGGGTQQEQQRIPGIRQAAAVADSSAGNGYDAVLSESEDLLQAIVEAQSLGRLRMSASYLTLLHARLVGLGKRFDKAISSQGKAKVTRELSDMMPHVEFDTAMMEHLAKAAEELHNARCGFTNGNAPFSGAKEVRALFASQLKSKLQERAAPESSPPRRAPITTGEVMSPLPNCNARELLAIEQPDMQPEFTADTANVTDAAEV